MPTDPSRWPYDLDELHDKLDTSPGARAALAEAIRHRRQLGYDDSHDAGHDGPDWAQILLHRVVPLNTPVDWPTAPTRDRTVEYLAEIAAVAIHAIDSMTAPTPGPRHDQRVHQEHV